MACGAHTLKRTAGGAEEHVAAQRQAARRGAHIRALAVPRHAAALPDDDHLLLGGLLVDHLRLLLLVHDLKGGGKGEAVRSARVSVAGASSQREAQQRRATNVASGHGGRGRGSAPSSRHSA